MIEMNKVVYFDFISGETLVHPAISTYMPNLTRGPYYDKNGQSFYIQMTRLHPPQMKTSNVENDNEQ